TLVKAALAHVQFETIHPFLDGNGRIGRMLINVMLYKAGSLKQPRFLYLSWYFKKNQQEYYRYLQSVRETGDWEGWIVFFLEGITEVSEQATDTAQDISKLFEADRSKIKAADRSRASMLQVHSCLQKNPFCSVKMLMDETKLSRPTVVRGMSSLENLGIVVPFAAQTRPRMCWYKEYMEILSRE
ncbi:MAG: Fic family protein, partial [Candidatus Eutrophobiaceae bacterium]